MNRDIDNEFGIKLLRIEPSSKKSCQTQGPRSTCNIKANKLLLPRFRATHNMRRLEHALFYNCLHQVLIQIVHRRIRHRHRLGIAWKQSTLIAVQLCWGQVDVLIIDALVAAVLNATCGHITGLEAKV